MLSLMFEPINSKIFQDMLPGKSLTLYCNQTVLCKGTKYPYFKCKVSCPSKSQWNFELKNLSINQLFV